MASNASKLDCIAAYVPRLPLPFSAGVDVAQKTVKRKWAAALDIVREYRDPSILCCMEEGAGTHGSHGSMM